MSEPIALSSVEIDRIVSYALADGGSRVEVYEECDRYFHESFSKDEFAQHIANLQALLEAMP